MAVLCMLSDFGVTHVRIDLEKSTLGFGMFNPANAMASAILQGLGADKVKTVRESVEKVNAQFRQVADREVAAQRQAQGGEQRIAVPNVMGTRRRR